MSDRVITAVDAWEVLDSRGDPTLRVRVETTGTHGTFSVPSGASTGKYEAVERRDGGARYGGNGVQRAVAAVCDTLAPVVCGHDVTEQATIDEALVAADGTDDLSRLGANAILGVSGAVAHAAAAARGIPLYQSLSPDGRHRLPLPMNNLLSGGAHAPGGLAIQDVLAVPLGADTYPRAIEQVWEVRRALKDRLVRTGHRPLVADEGGFSPALPDAGAAFELVIDAIETAGYRPGREVALAIDVAAGECFTGGRYELAGTEPLTPNAMAETVRAWCDRYPIVSVEDPLVADDWDGWHTLGRRLDGVQLLGDDFLVTDHARLERAIEYDAATAILVKPNQTGTITRAHKVITTAQTAGIAPVVSARSGETADTTIADLAVATNAGQLKVGSLARSERLAKWNRLLDLAHRTTMGYAGPTALATT